MEQVETIVPSAAANGTAALAAVMDNASAVPAYKRNRIQVSNTKKPLFFYVNLAKRYMQQYNEVELSALGMAIATVVTISEILKNNGLAIEKKIQTSTIDMEDENKGRLVQKAKIEILLEKNSADSDGSPKTNTTEEDNMTTTDSPVNATEHSSTAGSNAMTTTSTTATEEHTEETKTDDKKEEEEFVKEN